MAYHHLLCHRQREQGWNVWHSINYITCQLFLLWNQQDCTSRSCVLRRRHFHLQALNSPRGSILHRRLGHCVCVFSVQVFICLTSSSKIYLSDQNEKGRRRKQVLSQLNAPYFFLFLFSVAHQYFRVLSEQHP